MTPNCVADTVRAKAVEPDRRRGILPRLIWPPSADEEDPGEHQRRRGADQPAVDTPPVAPAINSQSYSGSTRRAQDGLLAAPAIPANAMTTAQRMWVPAARGRADVRDDGDEVPMPQRFAAARDRPPFRWRAGARRRAPRRQGDGKARDMARRQRRPRASATRRRRPARRWSRAARSRWRGRRSGRARRSRSRWRRCSRSRPRAEREERADRVSGSACSARPHWDHRREVAAETRLVRHGRQQNQRDDRRVCAHQDARGRDDRRDRTRGGWRAHRDEPAEGVSATAAHGADGNSEGSSGDGDKDKDKRQKGARGCGGNGHRHLFCLVPLIFAFCLGSFHRLSRCSSNSRSRSATACARRRIESRCDEMTSE